MNKMDYSDQHANYIRLLDTIVYLEKTPTPPQSWMDTHYKHMSAYRKHFPDFTVMHPEMESEYFRNILAESEDLLERMLTLYEYHRWFDVKDYLQFNKNLAYIVREIYALDEVGDMMSGLGF